MMVTTIKKGTSREKIMQALKKRPVKIKSPDLIKYCGSISLDEDPLEMQKKWRGEWE
jgi:hypothetical protein